MKVDSALVPSPSSEHDTLLDPVISVIIPAYNEGAYLRRTLNALRGQSYRDFEVIVVANGCTDDTPRVAAQRCHRLLVLPERSLGRARNIGALEAKGDILVFLDADTLLEPDALRNIATHFSPECAAGTVKGLPDTNRYVYRLFYALKNFLHSNSLHRGSSGVILCWKQNFYEAGGFDETLSARENSDLIHRLRSFGRYRYIHETAAITSMRRFEKSGLLHTVRVWFKLWLHSVFSDLRHRQYEAVR